VGTLAATNYSFQFAAGTLTITAASVTATAGSYSGVYDGSSHSPAACAVTGAYTTGLSCTNSPTSVGPGVGSGTVTPTVSGGSSNFAITSVNGNWSITDAALTVTASNQARSYGAANPTLTYAITGFVGGDTIAVVSGAASCTTTATATSPVGTYPITCTMGTLAATNYSFQFAAGTLTITAASVTATAGSFSGVYDGSSHAPSACAVTGAYTTGLSCTNSPTSVGPGVGSGTVTPTVSGGSSNFAITSVNGNWSITDAALTVTASNQTRSYGAANPTLTYAITGFVGGDTIAVVSGAASCTTTATATSPVGTYPITCTVGTLAATNYSFQFAAGTLTITAASVTATAGSYSGVYDGSSHAPLACKVTGTYTTGLSCTNNPASVGPGIGSGTVTPLVSGSGQSNFAITAVNGAWSITQAPATVTVSNLAQYYTGSPLPVTVTTIPPGLSVLVLYSSASYPSSTTAPTQPGSYTVTATVTDPNYVGQDTETLVIYPANAGLALQLRSGMPEPSPYGTMVYFDLGLGGAPCPTGTVQFYVDGTVSGSAVTLNGSSCSSPLTFQTATLEPGSHSVYAAYSGDTLHAAGNSNTVTHAVMADTTAVTLATTATSLNVGQPVTLTATVNPSSLDPSAHGPAGTVEFFDGSTSLGVITLSSSSPYTAVLTTSSLAAGPHSISATYTSSDGEFTGSSSAVAVTVTVNLIAPTINWANPANIAYGTPLSGTQLNATATDATNGNIPVAGTFTYTPAAGTVLPVGTVNLQVSFAPTNTATYSTQTATVTLTVTAATLTVTADNQARIYGASNPTLTYTITGFVNGDTIAVVSGAASCTTTATPTSPASGNPYPITCTQGTLSAANYSFQFVSGTLTVTTTPTLTVTANNQTQVYGATTPPLTYTITGFVNGDTIAVVSGTASCTTTATPASPVSGNPYPITCTQGTLSAANYSFQFVGGTLTVTAAPVTATAGSYTGVYDGSSHTTLPACAVTGNYTGDLSCTNNPASVGPDAGSGTVSPTVSGGTLSNFAITTVNGAWSITQAPATVTVNCPASVFYTGVAQTPCTATVTGAGGLSQPLTVSYTNNINPGTATASASFAGDANHAASSNSANFTISQAPATVTLGNLAQFYTGSPATPVTVTTVPLGLAVSVLYSSASYPSSATPPTQVGSYTVTATVTNPDYVGSATGTLVISTASSGLTLALRSGMPEPSPYGTMVYFDLGLGGTPCPTGTVQFFVDGAVSGSPVTLNGSSCSAPITFQTAKLEPGSHSVYAVYSGDSNYSAGNSNTVTHAVSADTTAVTLATSATTLTVGQSVTFTATVNPSSLDPSANGPAGTVQFFDGATSLGIVTLSSSSPYTAQLTTSTLTAGPHSISATYLPGGDNEFTGGTSSAITVTVTANLIAPTINWATPASIVYGTPLSGTQLDATATDPTTNNTVAGTFTYTPPSGTVLPVGTVNLQVLFKPTDTSTYSTQTATVTLTVTPATLTVTADNQSRAFGASNPPLTYTITGLVNGDTAAVVSGTASCTTTATPTSPASGSPYPITCTQGTLSAANYSFQFVAGTMTVTPAGAATLTVTANNQTQVYGAATPALTYTITGFVNGDTIAVVSGTASCTTTATPTSLVSGNPYPITCTQGTLSATNYTFQFTPGTLTVTPATTALSLTCAEVTYDGNAHACVGAATGIDGKTAVAGSWNYVPATETAVGSYPVTGTFTSTDSSYLGGTASGTLKIDPATSAVTLSCPASVVYSGAAQTPCTATVTGVGGLSQSLTVTYTNNTNAGTATASASFAGDSNHAAGSNSANFTITQATQAISFSQPTSPVIYGVPPLSLSATGGGSGKPVVFTIDAGSTGSGMISGSTLTVTGIGNLIIDANQAGDSNYLAATQVTRTIVVNSGSLTVSANNATRVYGVANPAFTGSVTGAVNGDTFTESYSTTATISSNVGTYPIVPSVAGTDLADYAVTVQDGTLSITQAATTTSLTASSSSVNPGQSVTLTAQVVSATTGTPTGSVAFYDGTSLLATTPVTAGTATLSTTSLSAGTTNALQAVYSGDINFTTSTSSTSISVAPLDFTMAVSGASSITVTQGGVATYQVALSPLYGNYPGPVSFTASGLPLNASVAFSPSTIAANGGKQTVTVTVQTAATAVQVSPSIGRKLAPLSLALLLIPLLGMGRMRRAGRRLSRLASLLLLLGCTLAGAMMTGCGGVFTQVEHDYTIMVTATSGNMQHTAPVTLKVQ
jgi:hypothetical protein